MQTSTDLETISDSKKVLQISTDLATLGESRMKEKSITHGINYTSAAPDPMPPPPQHLQPPPHHRNSPQDHKKSPGPRRHTTCTGKTTMSPAQPPPKPSP
ncbi:hypothetical protein QL285_064349 [Trifolium repens]|nr:hypothetical protein QL285_064349 [Trifolium repens]